MQYRSLILQLLNSRTPFNLIRLGFLARRPSITRLPPPQARYLNSILQRCLPRGRTIKLVNLTWTVRWASHRQLWLTVCQWAGNMITHHHYLRLKLLPTLFTISLVMVFRRFKHPSQSSTPQPPPPLPFPVHFPSSAQLQPLDSPAKFATVLRRLPDFHQQCVKPPFGEAFLLQQVFTKRLHIMLT